MQRVARVRRQLMLVIGERDAVQDSLPVKTLNGAEHIMCPRRIPAKLTGNQTGSKIPMGFPYITLHYIYAR